MCRLEQVRDEVDRGAPVRPWSATEPRWSKERMFSSKQRNWEGLAAGRKHLHHGQLLPGSTESTDEDQVGLGRTKTCWSEGASPGRSVDPPLSQLASGVRGLVFRPPPPPAAAAGSSTADPAAPLIQAIRSELRRFQRSQNSGVTIVTDPDLMDRESKA